MAKVRTPPRKTTQRRQTTSSATRRRPPSPPRAAFASALLAHAVDVVYVSDATGTIRYISPAVTRLLGYQPQEVVGKDSFSFVHPGDLPRVRDATAALLRQPGGSSARQEYRVRHHDGSWRLMEGVATNLLEDPAVAGIVITARDLTERAHTEVSLQESEARYRQLVDSVPTPVFVHAAGTVVYANAAALTFFGARSAEEVIGKPVRDLVPQTSHELQQQRIQQILTEGRAAQFLPFPFLRVDGQRVEAEAAGTAITYAGRPAVQTVLRELTVPPRDDQALQASEERYRNLFENANDAIATFSLDGVITSINRGAERLLGWSREEVVGQHYRLVAPPTSVATADERTRRFLAGEAMDSIFEIALLHKEGTLIPVEARTRPMKDREGRVTGFQGIFRDMRERKQTERTLRESQQLLERLADTLPDLVYLVEVNSGRLLYCNRRVTAVLGYARNEIEGKPAEDLRALVHEEDRAQVDAWAAQFATASDEDAFETEYRVKHLNGEYRWLHVRERVCTRTETGVPARILGMAEDVTARKRMQEAVGALRVQREKIPELLRKFREKLGYTQTEFGKIFGGFNQRQIGSYETGVADPSLDLLLAIQAQGFPLEHVLGETSTRLLDETLHYLTRAYSHQALCAQIGEVLQAVAARERDTITRALHDLGLDPKPLTAAQRDLLERLLRLKERDPESD